MTKKYMPAISLALLACASPSAVLGFVLNDASTETADVLKEVNQRLETLNSDTKKIAEQALNETKKFGDATAETKNLADKALTQQSAMNKIVEDLQAKIEGFGSSLTEVTQNMVDNSRQQSDQPMSMGQAANVHREQIEAFASGGLSGSLVLDVSNAITGADGSGGGLIHREEEREPVNMPRRKLLVKDLIGRSKTGIDLVPYKRQTLRDGAAEAIAAGGAYPEAAFGWTKDEAKVRKLGVITHVHEEVLNDADLLQGEIDGELRYDLELEEERQIIAGDGIGDNLPGLLTAATAFSAAAGLPNATRIDRLRLAFLQVTLADYFASSLLLNPTDWAAVEMTKDNAGQYIFANPQGVAGPVLWGRPVAESNSMGVGEWLTGDMKRASTYYDRQSVELLVSKEHGTNFGEDMVSIKARLRAALAHKRPAAMVKGDFTFA
jgi:HK97 family phage major capsid protein